MPWFHEFLTSISRSRARSRPGPGVRALAGALSAVLAFGAVSPGLAFASEADSEQEGSAPPGALPGLEGAELEPGGEEAVLEELPGTAGGGEESEEGPPLESEPPQESEVPPLPPEAPASTEAAPAPSEVSASAPSAGPEYGPAYEPASPPVENQALTAPPPASPPTSRQAQQPESAAQSRPEAPAPAGPSEEAPQPEPAPLATPPSQGNDAAGGLAGHSVHTVRAGECLWSIAEALLPAGAGNAEIEAEVQRLWRLNAARIGSGDPSLLYVGTELRLR